MINTPMPAEDRSAGVQEHDSDSGGLDRNAWPPWAMLLGIPETSAFGTEVVVEPNLIG